MPATKRGIYHNLKESNYTISNGEIVFFFSSKFYMHKFLIEYKDYRVYFKSKMDLVVHEYVLNMDMLADISLYRKIEKRGFRAWLEGMDISWRDLHLYALRRMTKKNTPDWYAIPKPKLDERKRIMESTYQTK